jgi:hypothetical protein
MEEALSPKGAETVLGITSPKGKKEKKNVYMSLGHASDIVSGDPLSIPTGCVYVTFTLCGEVSKYSHLILKAFEDPAVKSLLNDPVRHIKRLTEYFGETLHVHYPEAEDPTSRTYYDSRYTPFLAYDVKDHPTCFAKKSGLFRLGDLAVYKAPAAMQSREVHADSRPYTASYPCDNIDEATLKYLYRGSLFPTLEQVLTEYDAAEKPLTYKNMKRLMKPYKYTQSWAFERWPGVHYNFVCRGHAHAEENIKNSATKRRRAASAEAAAKLRGGTRRIRHTSAAPTRPYRASSSSRRALHAAS